jgi:hypothetical protein
MQRAHTCKLDAQQLRETSTLYKRRARACLNPKRPTRVLAMLCMWPAHARALARWMTGSSTPVSRVLAPLFSCLRSHHTTCISSSISLSLSPSLSRPRSLALALSPSLSLSLSLFALPLRSPSRSHSLSLSLSRALSLSPPQHTHKNSHSLTHSPTNAHVSLSLSRARALSLSLSLSLSLAVSCISLYLSVYQVFGELTDVVVMRDKMSGKHS